MMGGFCFVCGRGMVLDKSAGFTGSYSSRPKRMSLQLPPRARFSAFSQRGQARNLLLSFSPPFSRVGNFRLDYIAQRMVQLILDTIIILLLYSRMTLVFVGKSVGI